MYFDNIIRVQILGQNKDFTIIEHIVDIFRKIVCNVCQFNV